MDDGGLANSSGAPQTRCQIAHNSSKRNITTPTMTKTTSLAALALLLSSASAFTPSTSRPTTAKAMSSVPYFAEYETMRTPQAVEPTPEAPKPAPKKKNNAQHSSDGIFAPAVLFAKKTLGEERLNKVRAKAISMHSDVISSFVDTSEWATGQLALKTLFTLADKNGDGTICKEELRIALQGLGFAWLQDKQVDGIFKRADADGNGSIDMEEWMREAPKTLRTNLIKLAKKNGGELGFLA